ncbi:MAG: M15 family metallopeptidase [Polyangiaceae bacterium]
MALGAACSAPAGEVREPRAARPMAGARPARVAPVPAAGLAPAIEPEPAPEIADAFLPPAAPQRACNEQPPQPFLMRSSYAFRLDSTAKEAQRRKQIHRAAIEYRTRRYGHVEGFGDPTWNALVPKQYTKVSTFFGIRVRMNARVLAALACVEEAIAEECSATPYKPRVLDGLRARNTFYDGEVSNHVYGIAIDIDFDINPCCGCLPPLSDRPLCKEPAATPFERTHIPRCWVDAFERYGFYWLGHDALEDTMHFEFLGDPAGIARAPVQERAVLGRR